MTTINSLKKLTAVIVGGGSAADIPGETIPDVLEYLAKNYPGGGVVDDLEVKSTAGSDFGKTKITVTPTLTSGNSYVYKTSATTFETPGYLSTVSGGTSWNGTNEIEAEDGHYIGIYELNSSGKVVKFGKAIITVNLG